MRFSSSSVLVLVIVLINISLLVYFQAITQERHSSNSTIRSSRVGIGSFVSNLLVPLDNIEHRRQDRRFRVDEDIIVSDEMAYDIIHRIANNNRMSDMHTTICQTISIFIQFTILRL